ncbi:MAG: MATE family efflux transporter [Sandaracinaceae bacterium]|nr:MATE family efflux transporter [Sandaracinaceae bacterium]
MDQTVTMPKTVDAAARKLTHGPLAWAVGKFGLPLVVGMILHTAFNLVDMFMISRLPNSGPGLAALGICDMVTAVATILSNGISTATVAVISRRLGANDSVGVQRAAWQSLVLVAGFSLVFGLVGVFGHDFVIRTVMQAKGETADVASRYLQVLMGGCFSIFFLLQLTAILRAQGHAKSAAFLLILGNLINLALNFLLIYGEGPSPAGFEWAQPIARALHVPRMEVQGAAWSTLIGRTIPCIIGALLIGLSRRGPKFRLALLKPMWVELRNILQIGWPSSAQFVLRVMAILVFISLINANYTTVDNQSALVAYSICLRLETMALFIGMGWGAAASSFVGVNIGAGLHARAKRAGYIAAAYNVAFMLVLGIAYLVWSKQIIGFFDESPEVLRVGRQYLLRVGLSYAALGVGVVLSQAMTGAGETLASLIIDAVAIVGLTLPATYLVAETFGAPYTIMFWTIAASNVLAAAAFLFYYARGHFLEKKL